VAVYCEHGKVIQSDLKQGSVERSINLDKEGMPQQKYQSMRNKILHKLCYELYIDLSFWLSKSV
jgi:hypothetical protein